MRAYDIKPTSENIKETFKSNAIGRNISVIQFCTLLDFIEDSTTIALDGKWGSGKTFFVKQVKLLLDVYNSFIINPIEAAEASEIKVVISAMRQYEKFALKPQVSVYYDAWANDNDEDPILSLIYSIIQSADTDFSVSNKRDYLKLFGDIADFFTGKNISAILQSIKGDDQFESIKKETQIQELMTEFIDSLLIEHGDRLVVIIDELDRCKPSYAIQLLERVKHYFGDERVSFVFSINSEQLQHTIKKFYGNDFDATRYLDRFFDLRITMPKPNLNRYYDIVHFENSSYYFDKMCNVVIKVLQFELREIAKFIRLTKIAAYKAIHMGHGAFDNAQAYAMQLFIPIIIGLKICDESAYGKFISGKFDAPLIDMFRTNADIFRLPALLNEKETYDKNDKRDGIVYISPEDKIRQIYNALFAQDYNKNGVLSFYIGDMRFEEETRTTILRIASLLSEYADYEL